jgi:hypothetical protein
LIFSFWPAPFLKIGVMGKCNCYNSSIGYARQNSKYRPALLLFAAWKAADNTKKGPSIAQNNGMPLVPASEKKT